MKKMENLINMKKTVLQLEKEINSLGTNLSKVKNKDNLTMKKIIHNIDYLLTKNIPKNNITTNNCQSKINYFKNAEENKISENIPNIKYDNYMSKKTINQDYIHKPLIQFNKENINNQNQQCFKQKSCSSSKKCYSKPIYETESLIYYYDSKKLNQNTIVDNSRKKAYSKPKIMNKFYKSNTKKNNNFIITDCNYNYNNYISIQNERSINGQAKSFKHLTLNNNTFNLNDEENINNKGKNLNNNFFCNYTNKCGNIFGDNKNAYQSQNNYLCGENNIKKHKKEEEKRNITNYQNSENGIYLNNKNNKVFKRKLTRNNKSKFNSCSKLRSPLNLNTLNAETIQNSNNNNNNNNNQMNYHLNVTNNFKNDNNEKRNSNHSYKNIYIDFKNDENKCPNINRNSSQSKITINNIDNNYEHRNKNNNIEKNNINNSIGNNIDTEKVNLLLNAINVDNINEAIKKVNSLIKYEKYISELKQLYKENKENNNNYNEVINNNDLIWLSSIIKNYKRNETYKKYCKDIMNKNKIEKFEDFKKFINNIFTKNKKNKGFIVGVKNILCKDDICYTTKNNYKKIKYEPIKKIVKTEYNTLLNNSNNSNDINFSQKNVNFTMKNKINSKAYY